MTAQRQFDTDLKSIVTIGNSPSVRLHNFSNACEARTCRRPQSTRRLAATDVPGPPVPSCRASVFGIEAPWLLPCRIRDVEMAIDGVGGVGVGGGQGVGVLAQGGGGVGVSEAGLGLEDLAV